MKKMGCPVTPGKEKLIQILPWITRISRRGSPTDWKVKSSTMMTNTTDSTLIITFKNQRFVIHDVRRKIAALYDGEQIILTSVDSAEIYLSEYEKYFEDLWKQYYKSVNIVSRPHEKQMKGYMPVRYWKFLPEKQR